MDRIKRFFLGNLTEKVMALALALLVYGFVFGQRPVEQILRLPIQLANVPSNLVVSKFDVNSVDVRLSAPKTLLVGLEEKNLRAVIDLSMAEVGFQTHLFDSNSFGLRRGVTVQSVSPPEVSFYMDKLTSRIVPVVPTFKNRLPEGFMMLGVEVTPKEIEVFGPKHEVDGIEEVSTDAIDLSTLRGDEKISAVPIVKSDEVNMSFGGRVLVELKIGRERG